MNDLSSPYRHLTAVVTSTRATIVGLIVTGATLGACIEARRPVTQPDTAAPADATPPDTTTPADTTSPGDATVGDTTPECEAGNDAVCASADLSACLKGTCIEGRCVAVPVEGLCNPSDACGGGTTGICIDGACYQQNDGCAGDAVDGCHRSLCGLEGACTQIPAEGVPCISENTASGGLCNGIRLDPVDMCSAEGTCALRERDANVLPDANAITSSKWWVVTHRPADIIGRTRAGLFTFNANGNWAVDPFGASIFGTAGSRRAGPWCLDPTGALALALGQEDEATSALEGAFIGAYSRGAALIAGAGARNNELLIATRTGGAVIDVNGPYSTLLVRSRATADMGVYVGTLNFSLGKLEDEDALTGEDPGDVLTFSTATTRFGNVNTNGLVSMIAEFSDADGTRRQVEYVGAISPGGGAAILAAGNAEPQNLDYGFIVLLSYDNDADLPTAGAEPAWWNAALQIAPPPSGLGTNFTSTAATIHARGPQVIGGIFGADGAGASSSAREGRIGGGELNFARSGAIGAELSFATATRKFGGFMHPSRDFGVVYDAGDEDISDPDDVSASAKSKTFGFLIRRYETATTLGAAD